MGYSGKDTWQQQTVEYVQSVPRNARQYTQDNPDYVWIPLVVAVITSIVGPILVWWLKGKRNGR